MNAGPRRSEKTAEQATRRVAHEVAPQETPPEHQREEVVVAEILEPHGVPELGDLDQRGDHDRQNRDRARP